MNINIAGNLKRLRKERGITQENLADFIGVSFQAVSKWECGDGYPDITILPVLANFFDVTLDELVGMNEIKNAKKLDEIKEHQKNLVINGGTIKEIIELLRGGLKIFPNDYWLLSELVTYLHCGNDYTSTEEERKKNNEEAIKISERILEFCTDIEIRNRVQADMCQILYNIGEKEKAVEIAKKLPMAYQTREHTLPSVLDGKEEIKQRQNYIFHLTDTLANNIWVLVHKAENYTDEENLKLSQKVIDIYKSIYEEEDYDSGHCELNNIYISMAKIYIKQNKKDEAVKSLEEAAKHAIVYMNRSDETTRKSLLVNMLPGVKVHMAGMNIAKQTKNQIEKGPFESIREREEIKNILAELDKYAD